MIKDRDAPEEVIHIRQAWVKAINRVAEALAYRYKRDVNDDTFQITGMQTVIESVIALKCLLVDYGEATVRSDVIDWYNKHTDEIESTKSEMKRMRFYRNWFEYMVETLNKYGLLFESQPKGYSNVEMKSFHLH